MDPVSFDTSCPAHNDGENKEDITNNLPIELIARIFSFLPKKEFLQASIVNRRWRQTAIMAAEGKQTKLKILVQSISEKLSGMSHNPSLDAITSLIHTIERGDLSGRSIREIAADTKEDEKRLVDILADFKQETLDSIESLPDIDGFIREAKKQLRGYAWINEDSISCRIANAENIEKIRQLSGNTIRPNDRLIHLFIQADDEFKAFRSQFSSKLVNIQLLKGKKEGDILHLPLENGYTLRLRLSCSEAYEAMADPIPFEQVLEQTSNIGEDDEVEPMDAKEELDYLSQFIYYPPKEM